MKRLINNADDYGYRPDISDAIIESHLRGILTSTTALVNYVDEYDLKLIRKAPDLGVGLHLNITSGKPVTKEWQKRYGNFFRPKRNQIEQFNYEEWVEWAHAFRTEDIYAEYEAQYKKFIELFDRKPTHIDSHHYTSGLEEAFPAFIRLAKKYKLKVRYPVLYEVWGNQHPLGNTFVAPHLAKQLINSGIETTDGTCDKYFGRFNEGRFGVLASELSKIQIGETVEFYFHPGFEEGWRKADFDMLASDLTRQLVDGFNLQLASY